MKAIGIEWMVRMWAKSQGASIRDPSKRVAIMVPMPSSKLSEDEKISLRHLKKYLGSYDKFLLVPKGSGIRMDEFSSLELSRQFFGSVLRHNRLLNRLDFWKNFQDYEFVLMYHLDALVFSDQLDYWCNQELDYIGAPFVISKDAQWVTIERVGNGGFALYRMTAIQRVLVNRYLAKPRSYLTDYLGPLIDFQVKLFTITRAMMPKRMKSAAVGRLRTQTRMMKFVPSNDLLWSDEAQKFLPEFRVASLAQGFAFSFEVDPRRCFERNGGKMPFGCHAFHRYDRDFWDEHLLKEDACDLAD